MFPGLELKKSVRINYVQASFNGEETFERRKEESNLRYVGEWARQLLCVPPPTIRLTVDIYQFTANMSLEKLMLVVGYLRADVFLDAEDLAHLLQTQSVTTEGVFDPNSSWNHVLVSKADRIAMGVCCIAGTDKWTLSMRRKEDALNDGRDTAKKGERFIARRYEYAR